jgi:hypothetical protein
MSPSCLLWRLLALLLCSLALRLRAVANCMLVSCSRLLVGDACTPVVLPPLCLEPPVFSSFGAVSCLALPCLACLALVVQMKCARASFFAAVAVAACVDGAAADPFFPAGSDALLQVSALPRVVAFASCGLLESVCRLWLQK